MIATTIQAFSDRASWLAARRLTIGSSDAPIILGLGHKAESHARKSLLELWAEKTGKVVPEELDGVRLRVGHDLEYPSRREIRLADPRLAAWSPFHLLPIGAELVEGGCLVSVRREFRACTPDLVVDNAGPPVAPTIFRGPAEVKTVESFAADDWGDGPSAYSLVQLHHQLSVGGWPEGWIAAWIGFGRFELHHVEKDPELEELILQREDDFWRHVQQDIEPHADASESASRTLRKLHPRDSGEVIRVDDPLLAAAAADLAAIKSKLKDLGDQETAIENVLKQRIGDATELVVLADGEATAKFSWRHSDRKGYTVAASEVRTLRRCKLP